MLKKLFYALVVLLILALLGTGCWGLHHFYQWSWWLAVGTTLTVVLLFFVIGFVRRRILRQRERRFVHRILAQEKAMVDSAPEMQHAQWQTLQRQWEAAIGQLRHSHLRRLGNPLYVLPWYLFLGESGAGKSTAIKHSGLNTALTDAHHVPGVTSTKHCDWWFFEEAVILDAAGRYAIPVDPEKDRQEWELFLSLVARYRRREPFNGILITVASDRLSQSAPQEIEEMGRQLRQRLDHLMRVTGASPPVYLLITKADLIYGFEAFSDNLKPKQLAQAMGYLSPDTDTEWEALLDHAMTNILQRLLGLQRDLLRQGRRHPGILLFPGELGQLRSSLFTFLQGFANRNPYQEPPLLRGLFFSSARHQDAATSRLLKSFNLPAPVQENRDQSKFLQDLFTRILPQERYLFRPIASYLRLRRKTWRLALTVWCLACLCAAVGMTFSWQQQHRQIHRLHQHYIDASHLTADMSNNLLTLDQLREEIVMLHENQLPVWLRFGLDGSQQVEKQLRAQYVNMFQEGFLNPLDEKLGREAERFTRSSGRTEAIAEYSAFLSARIRLLEKNGTQNADIGQLDNYSARILQRMDKNMTPDMAMRFLPCYQAYLDWNVQHDDLNEEAQRYRTSLLNLVQAQGQDLHWLTENMFPDEVPITWQQFWPGLDLPEFFTAVEIEPAFTQAGYQHIQDTIRLLQQTLGDQKTALDTPLSHFWPWYQRCYLNAWLDLLRQPALMPRDFPTADDQDLAAAQLAVKTWPGLILLQRAKAELAPWADRDDTPEWLQQIEQVVQVANLATMEQKEREPSLVSRITGTAEKDIQQALNSLSSVRRQELHLQLQRSAAWESLAKALEALRPVSQTPAQAADLCRQAFEAPQDSNPLVLLRQQQTNLQQAWPASQLPGWIWRLIEQPGNYLIDWSLMQAGKALEENWQNHVLGQLTGTDPELRNQALFATDQGLAWKFLDQDAAPFVQRTQNGFRARQGLGMQLPLRTDFFTWLNRGRRIVPVTQDAYSVKLVCRPVNVNPEATQEPFAVDLVLSCNDGPVRLRNFNYPSQQVFTWKPNQCGDTQLTFHFETFTLEYRYPQTLGFAHFLADMADGHHRFLASQWPEQASVLAKNKVDWIDLSYQISGADPIVQMLQLTPQTPETLLEW